MTSLVLNNWVLILKNSIIFLLPISDGQEQILGQYLEQFCARVIFIYVLCSFQCIIILFIVLLILWVLDRMFLQTQ